MTMFSMKPKFDLAEFLAVPAPVGAARSRAARRRGIQFQRSEKAVAATKSDEASPNDTAPETGES